MQTSISKSHTVDRKVITDLGITFYFLPCLLICQGVLRLLNAGREGTVLG